MLLDAVPPRPKLCRRGSFLDIGAGGTTASPVPATDTGRAVLWDASGVRERRRTFCMAVRVAVELALNDAVVLRSGVRGERLRSGVLDLLLPLLRLDGGIGVAFDDGVGVSEAPPL